MAASQQKVSEINYSSIAKMIEELRTELAIINHSIRILESLSRGKRVRGRPPKFLSTLTESGKRRKKARKSR